MLVLALAAILTVRACAREGLGTYLRRLLIVVLVAAVVLLDNLRDTWRR